MVEKNTNMQGNGTDAATGRNAFALGTPKDYDRLEMRMADPRYLMFLMEKTRNGTAQEHEVFSLVMHVARLAPAPLGNLIRECGREDAVEFATFVYETRNRRAVNGLTRIVIGIVSEIVLPDYLRK